MKKLITSLLKKIGIISAPQISAEDLNNDPHLSILSAIKANAEMVVDKYKNDDFLKVDYSRESLNSIENVLDDLSDITYEVDIELVGNAINLHASYILNVAYNEFGGRFSVIKRGNEVLPILIVGEPNFEVGIIAHDKVKGRINGDPADNIPFFYQGFVEHVESATPGKKVIIA